MDRVGEIFAAFIVTFCLFVIFGLSIDADDRMERKIWKASIEQADEFVYSHISNDGERACFKLFDKDGKYLCEAILYLEDEDSSIDRSYSTIAWRHSSHNRKFSRKMFKLLYPRIPEEDLEKFVSNDELIRRLRNMK